MPITKAEPPANSTLKLTATPAALNQFDLHTKGVVIEATGGKPKETVMLLWRRPSGHCPPLPRPGSTTTAPTS